MLNINKDRYPDHSVWDDFCDNVDVPVSQTVCASQRVERERFSDVHNADDKIAHYGATYGLVIGKAK